MINLIITTNSPGEIAGWVVPILKEFKKREPESRVYVFVPPCQYASGREKEVLAALPEVDQVYGFKELIKLIFFNIRPDNLTLTGKSVVLHLGGDLFYSAMLSRRLKTKAFACTNGYANWVGSFEKFFLANDKMVNKMRKNKVPASKIQKIGYLFYEIAANEEINDLDLVREKWGLKKEERVIGLFPGSKPYQLHYMLPFFLKIAELISQKQPQIRFLISKSPFTAWSAYSDALKLVKQPVLEGVSGVLEYSGSEGIIRTAGGVEVLLKESQSAAVMKMSEFVLSIPGTNQVEAAVLGIPSIVLLPLNKPEELPLDGAINYLNRLPIFGKILKKYIVLKINQKMKFISIPNRMAETDIIPEMRAALTASMVAAKIEELLGDPGKVKEMSDQLKELTRQDCQPGALLLDTVLANL